MKHFYGRQLFVQSAGVRAGEPDAFAIAVMEELGIDISIHKPISIDELFDTSFDVVISLSPEAHHKALEMTRTMAVECEYWPTFDPRSPKARASRCWRPTASMRDQLSKRIRDKFGGVGAPVI